VIDTLCVLTGVLGISLPVIRIGCHLIETAAFSKTLEMNVIFTRLVSLEGYIAFACHVMFKSYIIYSILLLGSL
jgi:hypothetical protein